MGEKKEINVKHTAYDSQASCDHDKLLSVVTWSLFLPESDSEGVGSDSDGDPLSSSLRSLDEPRAFLGGGGR